MPSITAVADSVSFGVVQVSGRNFDSGDAITIRVINPSTGAVLQTVGTGSSGNGFTSTFAIAAACGLSQVELQAVDDDTNQTSDMITVTLGSPLTLAQNQLQAAEDDLASALSSPPAILSTANLIGYLQEVSALQAAVIAGEARVGTAQSGTCS
jgi:hypothetical protein